MEPTSIDEVVDLKHFLDWERSVMEQMIVIIQKRDDISRYDASFKAVREHAAGLREYYVNFIQPKYLQNDRST